MEHQAIQVSAPHGLDEDAHDSSVLHAPHSLAQARHGSKGVVTHIPLPAGAALVHCLHRFSHPTPGQSFELGELRNRPGEDFLTTITVARGGAVILPTSSRESFRLLPGQDFFHCGSGFSTRLAFDGTGHCHVACFSINYHLLTDLLGANMAEQVIGQIGARAGRGLPAFISEPLRNSHAEQLDGRLKSLYAYSRVIEYLCNLANHLKPNGKKPMSSHDRRERIHDLHAYLLRSEGKLPSLEALSKQFGMSARWMNEAFQKEFGAPIFKYLTERRLQAARNALIESPIPIKQLAEKTGYSHVNHFITAFSKQFGYTPGSLRRQGVDTEDGIGVTDSRGTA